MTDLEQLRRITEHIWFDGTKAAQALLPSVTQAADAINELAAAIRKSDLNSRVNAAFRRHNPSSTPSNED
jgi:hypothetical protein